MNNFFISKNSKVSSVVFNYIKDYLSNFNTSDLESIKLLKGCNKKSISPYGLCVFPTEIKGYRLICWIAGEYPGSVISTANKKHKKTKYKDKDEAAIWILGHELFHYLSDSKQLTLKNNEKNADYWGDHLLRKFRRFKNKINKP